MGQWTCGIPLPVLAAIRAEAIGLSVVVEYFPKKMHDGVSRNTRELPMQETPACLVPKKGQGQGPVYPLRRGRLT